MHHHIPCAVCDHGCLQALLPVQIQWSSDRKSVEVLRTPIKAPRANAICERLLGSVRRECLDHMLLRNEAHLRHVLKEYVTYFNRSRSHLGINQQVPEHDEFAGQSHASNGTVVAFPVLGGLHHEYRRVG